MIKIIETNKINSNGTIEIKGKLLKVVVVTKEKMTNVRIRLKSYADELMIDDHLTDLKTVFYPRCIVNMNQYNQNLDYYYLQELIRIELDGIGNDFIENILFYIEQ